MSTFIRSASHQSNTDVTAFIYIRDFDHLQRQCAIKPLKYITIFGKYWKIHSNHENMFASPALHETTWNLIKRYWKSRANAGLGEALLVPILTGEKYCRIIIYTEV